METIEIVGKNKDCLTLKNSEDLAKVYKLIVDETDFVVKHPDYSEVFLTTNFAGKLKAGDFKLNASNKGE